MRSRAGMASLLMLCLLSVSGVARAQKEEECWRGRGKTLSRMLNGYLLQVGPVRAENPNEGYDGYWCGARVIAPDGTPLFLAEDAATKFNEVTGKDINGDGAPDAVFEGFSGGAHCCWTYWIVSVGSSPGLILKIENEREVDFYEENGRVEIFTLDGAFDYFDGLSHAGTVFPRVVFRLQGNKLKDVGSEYWKAYEKEIAEALGKLTPDSLRRFRSVRMESIADCTVFETECFGVRKTKSLVLRIVLAYLYSGREEEAWKTLEEMWPPKDKERIRKLILETRAGGVLRYTRRAEMEKQTH